MAAANPNAVPISSFRNPLVQNLRRLAADHSVRTASGLGVLEGVRLAEEALRAGIAVDHFLYSQRLTERDRGQRLVAALRATGAQGHLAADDVIARTANTQAPQGLVAAFRIPMAGLADLRPGLILVAEGVQDPGNLGTLVRACHGFGGGGVVVLGGADPWAPKVVRAAMGGLFHLPVVRLNETAPALATLREQGYRVLLAEAEGEAALWDSDLGGNVALLLGSEATGPSAAARAGATGTLRIPMPGAAESLNVAMVGTVLLYEGLRQRLNGPARTAP